MIPIRGRLQLEIRNLKETLFNEGYLFVSIADMDEVEIELDEFRALSPVVKFGDTLRQAMQSILEEVDESFIEWVSSHPSRYLTAVLTGGGASLPMIKELAKGEIQVNGRRVRVEPALQFPNWLRENYPELEDDYPRVAVSLGGARRTVIHQGGVAKLTAGGIATPRLGGYYVTGQ
jgi:molecular chaperone HscA